MPKVVILSPNRYSAYSITVAEQLLRNDVTVSGIVIRRMLNFSRLKSELKSYGLLNLSKRVWTKVVRRFVPGQGWATDFQSAPGPNAKSLQALASRNSIPILECENFNDIGTVEVIGEMAPDLLAFTGGGILRQPLLSVPEIGTVNVHLGILPKYRGMDPIEWALLEREPSQVGLSAHLINEQIDLGPILNKLYLPPEPDESLEGLTSRVEASMSELMVQSCTGLLADEIQPAVQDPAQGHQYYRIHPRLRTIAGNRLARQQ